MRDKLRTDNKSRRSLIIDLFQRSDVDGELTWIIKSPLERLTVFGFVDNVFGLEVCVDGTGRQVLRAAGFDFHVLVGLQVQLEHVEHIAVVENVPRGFAEIAEGRRSHLDSYFEREAAEKRDGGVIK